MGAPSSRRKISPSSDCAVPTRPCHLSPTLSDIELFRVEKKRVLAVKSLIAWAYVTDVGISDLYQQSREGHKVSEIETLKCRVARAQKLTSRIAC